MGINENLIYERALELYENDPDLSELWLCVSLHTAMAELYPREYRNARETAQSIDEARQELAPLFYDCMPEHVKDPALMWWPIEDRQSRTNYLLMLIEKSKL